jgi:hypothetical protein
LRVASTCTTADVASSYCCGLAAAVVTCNGSPAATTHAAAHDALSERRPITSDVLSLSALMGARVGTAGDALTTKKKGGG